MGSLLAEDYIPTVPGSSEVYFFSAQKKVRIFKASKVIGISRATLLNKKMVQNEQNERELKKQKMAKQIADMRRRRGMLMQGRVLPDSTSDYIRQAREERWADL